MELMNISGSNPTVSDNDNVQSKNLDVPRGHQSRNSSSQNQSHAQVDILKTDESINSKKRLKNHSSHHLQTTNEINSSTSKFQDANVANGFDNGSGFLNDSHKPIQRLLESGDAVSVRHDSSSLSSALDGMPRDTNKRSYRSEMIGKQQPRGGNSLPKRSIHKLHPTNGEVIETYSSLEAACKQDSHLSKSNMYKVLSGSRMICGGYRWCYADEEAAAARGLMAFSNATNCIIDAGYTGDNPNSAMPKSQQRITQLQSVSYSSNSVHHAQFGDDSDEDDDGIDNEQSERKKASSNKKSASFPMHADDSRVSHLPSHLPTLSHAHSIPASSAKRSVVQVSMAKESFGQILNTYRSIRIASDAINCERSLISKCCRGLNASAAGFIWRYEDAVTALITDNPLSTAVQADTGAKLMSNSEHEISGERTSTHKASSKLATHTSHTTKVSPRSADPIENLVVLSHRVVSGSHKSASLELLVKCGVHQVWTALDEVLRKNPHAFTIYMHELQPMSVPILTTALGRKRRHNVDQLEDSPDDDKQHNV